MTPLPVAGWSSPTTATTADIDSETTFLTFLSLSLSCSIGPAKDPLVMKQEAINAKDKNLTKFIISD
jgi:hypothetical protein